MKNELLKKAVPHVVGLLVFLIVSIVFCKPVLEGNVLSQHDTIGWKGMAQSAFEYKEKNGHFPLWNTHVFSGMPNYQIALEGKGVMPNMTKILSLGLPKPINFFFLACVCFYILCISLRIKPVIGILAALGFAFSTYNPVVINAGHDTQMMATAYMPLLIAGLINTYEKRYWLGLALTTFATFQQVNANHLQISYYTFLIAVFITLGYLISWILKKDFKHLGIAAAITVVAALIGVAGNALVLKTTSEYTKYTMRGGKDISIEGDSVTTTKTSGLDTSYAFEYSLGNAESLTLLMPNAFGGHSSTTFDENSHVAKALIENRVPESDAIRFASGLPKYWGALPYTAGPAYLGVFIFVLGLIGFVIVKTPLRWALLAATLFGIMISWGKNLVGFNVFLFENLPLYNKFRAPSMAQVIPQFTIGVMAALALQQLFYRDNSKESLKNDFKKLLFTVGGLFAILGILYLTMSYSAPQDGLLRDSITRAVQGNTEFSDIVMSGIKADRKAMFGGQLFRALGFTVLLLGTLYAFVRNWIKPLLAGIIIIVISTIELAVISSAYLNEEAYVSPDEFTTNNFRPTPIDNQIRTDNDPSYRVYYMSGSSFSESRTSYFHRSIGGYHPAKLRIYQDIIERYLLSGRPNPQVLNMLNTRYVIVENPQSGQQELITNPEAFGPAWLVKNVEVVDNRAVAIQSIGTTNLKDTAIVEKTDAAKIVQPQWDSTATIKLLKTDSDAIEYESNANTPQFAVFSEIYYPKGWNAYIDDKKTDYVNVNYLLRGMSLPAGKHTIRFVFEPASVKQGNSISFMASILILLILLGGLFMAWKESKKTSAS